MAKDFLSYDNSLKRYQTVDNQIEKLDTAVKYIINNDQSFYRIAVMNNNIANLSLLYKMCIRDRLYCCRKNNYKC